MAHISVARHEHRLGVRNKCTVRSRSYVGTHLGVEGRSSRCSKDTVARLLGLADAREVHCRRWADMDRYGGESLETTA